MACGWSIGHDQHKGHGIPFVQGGVVLIGRNKGRSIQGDLKGDVEVSVFVSIF